MISSVIIDDEGNARDTLRQIIGAYTPEVEVLDEGTDMETGLQVIQKHSPQLVFLDIKMPDGSGFELLRKLPRIDFKLVFVTAYDEYAVKAFRFSAFNYLLKPVDPDELIKTVDDIKSSLEKETAELKLKAFLANIDNISKEVKKIVLKTSDSIHLVNVSDIIRCESQGNYTEFILSGGRKILVSKTLKEFDGMLGAYGFFRTHQSHLINLGEIDKYEKREGGHIIMTDGSSVPVSTRKKEQLIRLFNQM
mgnify:CR=1 FL=1